MGGALTAAALSPSLSAMSELAAASSTVGAAADDEESEAICLRTRSKHPLAQADFDPDMFDRLLAEFDPDVEPLLDEEMYQQFLQVRLWLIEEPALSQPSVCYPHHPHHVQV